MNYDLNFEVETSSSSDTDLILVVTSENTDLYMSLTLSREMALRLAEDLTTTLKALEE